MRSFLMDLIRIFATALLLFSHINGYLGTVFGNFFGFPGFYFVSLGGFAVSIYLFLSGAALEYSNNGRKLFYWRFIYKRFTRIYPIYYLSLVFSLGLAIAHQLYSGSLSCRFCTFSDLFLSLTGFYAFFGQWGGPILNTSWFIGLIMVLYFLYPLITYYLKKYPHLTLFGLLIISVFARYLLGKNNWLPNRPLDWFPLCRVFEFGLGIYLVRVSKHSIWTDLKVGQRVKNVLLFFSELSFPLFLIHYPLLFILNFKDLPHFFTIPTYLLVSVGVSYVILFINKYLSKKFVSRQGLEP